MTIEQRDILHRSLQAQDDHAEYATGRSAVSSLSRFANSPAARPTAQFVDRWGWVNLGHAWCGIHRLALPLFKGARRDLRQIFGKSGVG